MALDLPLKSNLFEEFDALLGDFALDLEGSLILDPPTQFGVGRIALRNIAVSMSLFKFNELAISTSPKTFEVNTSISNFAWRRRRSLCGFRYVMRGCDN
jgi:hypothetical protein